MYIPTQLNLDMATARTKKGFFVRGYIVQLSGLSDASITVDVWFKHRGSGDPSGPFPLRKSDRIKVPDQIEQVLVSNSAFAGETAVLSIINMSPEKAPREFEWQQNEFANIDSISKPVKVKGAANLATPAAISVGTTATKLFDANTNAQERWIYNPSSTETLRIGPSGVTATTGIRLAPESGGFFDLSGKVYGIYASGSANVETAESSHS